MTKLQSLLLNPAFEESWVVNLLVQIRKIIDKDRKQEPHDWSIVNFFCTWALHSELSRDKFAIGVFFTAFDFRDGMELEDFFCSEYFRNFVALHGFRTELAVFLREHHLPMWLVEGTEDWLRFVYLYAGAVADAPIIRSSSGILPEEIEELRLDRLKDPSGQEFVRTRVRLKDGRDYLSMHLIPLGFDTAEPLHAYLRRRFPDLRR